MFSQKDAESVSSDLRKRGILAYPYHANMDPDDKSKVHRKWTANKIQVCRRHTPTCPLDQSVCQLDKCKVKTNILLGSFVHWARYVFPVVYLVFFSQ